MNRNSRSFKAVDIIYILMMVVPICFSIVIKVLTKGASDGISITGADIFFVIDMPIQNLPITESQINSWMVMIAVTGLCLFLTHGITSDKTLIRHHIAEWIVEKVCAMTKNNMGAYFSGFAPFVVSIISLSAFSSLLTLFGLYPPTSDIIIVGGWAILVFVLITYYKLKCGPVFYVKTMASPLLLTPLNVISEVATPISMAFRHYGNVLSGSVISVLVAAGLQFLSSKLLGFLPGFLNGIPFLQIGVPAILSIYFDVFSGCLQAYIFAMLTMMYISDGFPAEEYGKRKLKNNN